MIVKVRELLGITRSKHDKKIEAPATMLTEQKPVAGLQFGILSALAGTWHINAGGLWFQMPCRFQIIKE